MLESPLASIGRLPAPVRVLLLGTFVNRAGTLIFPYLTLVLRRDFGLSAERTALLVFGFGAGTLVSILLGGVLTDRLGRRRTLLLSLLGGGAMAVSLGFAPSVAAFVPLLVAFGFLAELYRPASSAMIADLLPSSQRAVGFAALRVAVNLGFAIGTALGGLLADVNWRLLFVGDGLTTLAFGAIVFARVAETRLAPALKPPSAEPPAARPAAWWDPVFARLLVANLLFAIVFLADLTVLPLSVTLGAGYPAWVYGLLLGVNGLLIAAFEISAVSALSGLRRLRVAAVGMLVTGAGFALNGIAPHWGAFLAGVLVWTVGEILTMPQAGAFAADWAPPAARGRYLSLFTATFSLAWALSPVLLLPLHARLGDRLFWPVAALGVLPAAALLLELDRSADHPERLRGLSS